MFRLYAGVSGEAWSNAELIWNSAEAANPDECGINSLTCTIEINKIGSLKFTITSTHPYYDQIEKRKTILTLIQDDADVVFRGPVKQIETKLFYQKNITAESDLTYFSDSVFEPTDEDVTITPKERFSNIIENHNTQMANDPEKVFTVGTFTDSESASTEKKYAKTGSYNDTISQINTDFGKELYGFLRIRYSSDLSTRYIDYLESLEVGDAKDIQFAVNMADFKHTDQMKDIFTVLIPTGGDNLTIEDVGSKLSDSDLTVDVLRPDMTTKTIALEIDGKYIKIPEGIQKYGYIYEAKSLTVDSNDGSSSSGQTGDDPTEEEEDKGYSQLGETVQGETEYIELTDEERAGKNPKEEGWYEYHDGTGMVPSTDTTYDRNKTYYVATSGEGTYKPVRTKVDNPRAAGFYEMSSESIALKTEDQQPDPDKEYFYWGLYEDQEEDWGAGEVVNEGFEAISPGQYSNYSSRNPNKEGWYELIDNAGFVRVYEKVAMAGREYYITSGRFYEYREVDYSSLLSKVGSINPQREGWWEQSSEVLGMRPTYHTTVISGYTYYKAVDKNKGVTQYEEVVGAAGMNPKEMGLLEKATVTGGYVHSFDEYVVAGTTYYRATSANAGYKACTASTDITKVPVYKKVTTTGKRSATTGDTGQRYTTTTGHYEYTKTTDLLPVSGRKYYTKKDDATSLVKWSTEYMLLKNIKPAMLGWYTRSWKAGTYTASSSGDVVEDSTEVYIKVSNPATWRGYYYYDSGEKKFEVVLGTASDSPAAKNWYVKQEDTTNMILTADPSAVVGKIYYQIKHNIDFEYEPVTDTAGKNPKEEGWYVYDDHYDHFPTEDTTIVSGKKYYTYVPTTTESSEAAKYGLQKLNVSAGDTLPDTTVYTPKKTKGYLRTTDTTVQDGKTYYHYIVPDFGWQKVEDTAGKNPKEEGWYEFAKADPFITQDTEWDDSKTYYFLVSDGVQYKEFDVGDSELLYKLGLVQSAAYEGKDWEDLTEEERLQFAGPYGLRLYVPEEAGYYLTSDTQTGGAEGKTYYKKVTWWYTVIVDPTGDPREHEWYTMTHSSSTGEETGFHRAGTERVLENTTYYVRTDYNPASAGASLDENGDVVVEVANDHASI